MMINAAFHRKNKVFWLAVICFILAFEAMSAYGFDHFGSPPSRNASNTDEGNEELLQRIMAQFFSQAEQLSINRQPPTSPLFIEELDIIHIDNRALAKYGSEPCPVCTEKFALNDETRKLPCGHLYHDDCILPWLTAHNTCPLCRHRLPTLDPVYESVARGDLHLDQNRNPPRSAPINFASLFGGANIHGVHDNANDDEDENENPMSEEERRRNRRPEDESDGEEDDDPIRAQWRRNTSSTYQSMFM